MRKNLVLVIFIMVTFLAASLPAMASSSDDYKVIKNAVKGKKGGEAQWFKLTVFDKKQKKNKVSIKVPLALLEALTDCVDVDKVVNVKEVKGKDIDFKKIMKVLKENGPMTLIEVDEDDELIKIWFE